MCRRPEALVDVVEGVAAVGLVDGVTVDGVEYVSVGTVLGVVLGVVVVFGLNVLSGDVVVVSGVVVSGVVLGVLVESVCVSVRGLASGLVDGFISLFVESVGFVVVSTGVELGSLFCVVGFGLGVTGMVAGVGV